MMRRVFFFSHKEEEDWKRTRSAGDTMMEKAEPAVPDRYHDTLLAEPS